MSDPRALQKAWAQRLRRLDLLPSWPAWSIGLVAGALIGTTLTGFAPSLVAVFAFLGLLGGAAALAWSGEPVAVAAEQTRRNEPLVFDTESRKPLVNFLHIPGGTFRMGSPEIEEGCWNFEVPVHEIRLSPFECMQFPVTRRLYRQITGTDPGWPKEEVDERPVNNISWLDAVAFCNLLSEKEGLMLCYRIDGEDVSWNHAADGYRLLTEAEWEYACRAGSTTRWSFGDDEALLGEHAWFFKNSSDQPQPVGLKRPNSWGLHDMHGNVYEWCWDWFGPYSAAATTDPHGPEKGTARVLRGGAFFGTPMGLRSAARIRDWPVFRFRIIGFRCARGSHR